MIEVPCTLTFEPELPSGEIAAVVAEMFKPNPQVVIKGLDKDSWYVTYTMMGARGRHFTFTLNYLAGYGTITDMIEGDLNLIIWRVKDAHPELTFARLEWSRRNEYPFSTVPGEDVVATHIVASAYSWMERP